MGLLSEFKSFAMKGNVVDLAVGIIIGGAFGSIVSSLVQDVMMPPIGMVIGGVNFTDIKLTLKQAVLDSSGKEIAPAVAIGIGKFVQHIFDFLITAFAIFMLIKGMNRFKAKQEEAAAAVTPPAPSKEEQLLTEIRDLLKK